MSWAQTFFLKNKYGFTTEEINYFKNINGDSKKGIEEKYLSQEKYNSFRNLLESGSWRAIVHNKWITSKYFDSNSIKQPVNFGLLHAQNGKTSEGKRLSSADDLGTLIKQKNLQKFVLKHIGGGLGHQVYIIDRVEQVDGQLILKTIDNRRFDKQDINDLLEREVGNLKGYIVQERLQVHSELSNITQSGLASIRIYTLLQKNGISKSKAAFIRFGTKGKATDHSHNDGIYAPIDLNTGTVKKGICISKTKEWRSTHLETGKTFEGLKIPYWDQLLQLAVSASESCIGLKWVGWDLMVTQGGPRLIEGNVGDNDFKSAQLIFGGFIANGIFDEWVNELDLPKEEKKSYIKMKNWKKRALSRFLPYP